MRPLVRPIIRLVIACMLVAILHAGTSCKRTLAKRDAGGSSEGDDADEQLQEKIDEYVKCLNALSTPVRKSRHRYLTWIPSSGPVGNESFADIHKLPAGAAAQCAAGVAKAKTLPPNVVTLENAAAEFASAASEVDRLTNDAQRYFETKEFRADRFARGKAMHPRLMAAWDRFSRADAALHDIIDGITKPLARRVLQRIEREDGKRFRYHRKDVLITARELVEASDPVTNDHAVDFPLYVSADEAFETSLRNLEAYGALQRADLSKEKLAPSYPKAETNYDAFLAAARSYQKAAKDFLLCLREAPARAKTATSTIDVELVDNCGDAPGWKRGEEVVKKYNDFVQVSNDAPFP